MLYKCLQASLSGPAPCTVKKLLPATGTAILDNLPNPPQESTKMKRPQRKYLGGWEVSVTVPPPDSLTVLKAQLFNWLQLQALQHCLSWDRNHAVRHPCFKNRQPGFQSRTAERLLTGGCFKPSTLLNTLQWLLVREH